MAIHTILIGTSKTVDGKEYFCKGMNISKFWGTLAKVDSKFSSEVPMTSELKKRGVMFQDISSAHGGEEKRDKHIKVTSLKNGFKNFENTLEENKDIETIAFIGKRAARWFFIHFLDRISINDGDLRILDKGDDDILFKYFEYNFTINFGNKEISCTVLPNTGRQWNPKHWISFWEKILKK